MSLSKTKLKGKARRFLRDLLDPDHDGQLDILHSTPSAPADASLVHSFNSLTLSGSPQHQQQGSQFIGGFHPGFATVDQFGPIPPAPDRPPCIPTPWVPTETPHSLTMQMALRPEGHQIPSSSVAPPSRPSFPQMHTTSAPPKINTSVTRPPATPGKPKRSNSSSSSASPSSSSTQQCAGVTKAGKRCTRQVKVVPAISQALDEEETESMEVFCFQHQKELMGPSGFYARKNGEWVKFEDWIPSYLHPDTQVAIRVEMEKSRSSSDVSGYIYTFEIRDSDDAEISLKVGRAVNLVKRIDQWGKQCGSKEQVLRGWYPGIVEADEGSLLKGRVKDTGDKTPWCHRLERLIHLELADLVSTRVYLDSKWPHSPEVKPKSSNSSKDNKRLTPCVDCGAVHKEIFSFKRLNGRNKGKEWETIVKPVIEKWGAFVCAFV